MGCLGWRRELRFGDQSRVIVDWWTLALGPGFREDVARCRVGLIHTYVRLVAVAAFEAKIGL